MNSPIFTLGTGTPTARAESALPPTAKIQLPTLVRSRIHEASATHSSHQITVILTVMNPSGISEAKIARPEVNPSSSETLSVATVPVVALVTPRLIPRSMKNVDSVIRNEGILVFTTRYPLMNPIANAITRLSNTPTHRLSESWNEISAAANAEVTTETPDDRSNSPPIINSATPTATIPIVDAAYNTVANAGNVRNGGAIAKKKTKIAIAATTAPISGRDNNREANDRLTGAGASAAGGGCVWGVVAGELMINSR